MEEVFHSLPEKKRNTNTVRWEKIPFCVCVCVVRENIIMTFELYLDTYAYE